MLVYVSSKECLDIFPLNSADHFMVKLPMVISSGKFTKCSLVELSMPLLRGGDIEAIYVLTNFVTECIVGNKTRPTLFKALVGNIENIVFGSGKPVYVPVKNIESDILEVKIVDDSFNKVLTVPGNTYCTFHFLDAE